MRAIFGAVAMCVLAAACDSKLPGTDGSAGPIEAAAGPTEIATPPPPPVVERPEPSTIYDLNNFPTGVLKSAGADGNAEVQRLGARFILSDTSNTEHRYAVWRFPDVAPETRYVATAKIEKIGVDTAGTLLRLAEGTSSGERKADCSFQVGTGEASTRDAATAADMTIQTEDDSVTVSCAITTGAAPKGLVVYLLPAVGPNMTSYSETGVGSVQIASLDVKVGQ